MYRPSELHAFLITMGISPKKGLSQNFLIDGNIIRKIIKVSDLKQGDLVIEIGPGPGSLTQALLEAGAFVIAIEKDPPLANALERFQTESKQLKIKNEDVLKINFSEELAPLLDHEKKAKVIANLPYHLTTPILTQLVTQRTFFSSLVLMVQEEVARRMTAKPGCKEYGSLTLFLNFYCETIYAFSVSHHCFYPAPKVDSAIVQLHLRKPPLPESEQKQFFQLTRTAFAKRRKMVRVSLKDLYPSHQVEQALIHLGIDAEVRPEMLSLEQFIALFRQLSKLY